LPTLKYLYFKKGIGTPHVKQGEQDDYPDYLLMLFNKSAKHAAIINGKCTYILGNGLKADTDTGEAFLGKANESQSWDELTKLICLDLEIFGGFYLQVIPKFGGGYNVYHMPFERSRRDEDGFTFFYKKDWKSWQEQAQEFPAFVPGVDVPSVFYYKENRPGCDIYPLPNYIAAANLIESDIEVSKHVLTNAKTGFSASKFINFYNGEPDESKKAAIQRRLENASTGSEGRKILIGFNNDPSKRPTVDDLGTSDLTKENFQGVNDLIMSEMMTAHGVTHPLLFGVQEAGKLGNATELKIAFDIWKNTYSNSKQRQIESIVNFFAKAHGVVDKFVIQDIEPITESLDIAAFKEMLPLEWIYEKFGIDKEKYPAPAAVETPSAAVTETLNTNENLRNLTGRQYQQMQRIIRQYHKGQLSEEQAMLLLKSSLGLNDDECRDYVRFER
jgi:hypothetical protein